MSKLQTMIALSTTEAEYMALSAALREVIYLINLMEELKKYDVPIINEQPSVESQT